MLKLSLIIISIGLLTACTHSASSTKMKNAQSVSQIVADMQKKVSVDLRTEWASLSQSQRQKTKVECFVRLSGDFGARIQAQLREVGYQYRSDIALPAKSGQTSQKTVLTGRISMERLPDLAALSRVEWIEGAVSVKTKQKSGQPRSLTK